MNKTTENPRYEQYIEQVIAIEKEPEEIEHKLENDITISKTQN